MKKGTYDLHPESNFNFQLNRTIMWGNGDIEEIKKIAHKIKVAENWVNEMATLANKAEANNQIQKAIGYYRMAEFFEPDGSHRKIDLYTKSKSHFYEYHKEIFDTTIKRDTIKYESGKLPVWIGRPQNEIKDTVILHGGNDSYMEEFLPTVQYLMSHGIAVYIFDGPGQGAALREHKLHYTYQWEKPIKALLDNYQLSDVTIIGVSLGGMLAPRAAAFDKRIERVVAWGVMPSFYDVISSKVPKIMDTMMKLKLRGLVNALIRKKMKNEPLAKWGISHGMFSMNVKTPYDYIRATQKFEMESIGDKITQDFLLIGSNEDHFIPIQLYKKVIDAIPNVASLTYKMYTKKHSAENHCNIGNTKLVLDDIIDWITNVKK